MNLARPSLKIVSFVFKSWLALLRHLPKQKCEAFGANGHQNPCIGKVYVINLDRAPSRWSKIQIEMQSILDASGKNLLNLTERHVAVDANKFLSDPSKDADIDPFYTLGDQLFVEPQPLVFPTKFELNSPIRMSRAEIAVARSHINVWRKVALGDQEYVMILEDDVWFRNGFTKHLDQGWKEVVGGYNKKNKFDVFYLSYKEAKHGAPKSYITSNIFCPVRGLWHLSGYILSREGAKKLLQLLPCRGPVDLWINHHFESLDVFASKKPIISQRRDVKSSNSYSILPALTTIGAINSEGPSLFNSRPTEQPVFAVGFQGSGHSSLAMALGMLGYRCCSDLDSLPDIELEKLLKGEEDRVFNAYVNIGFLEREIKKLRHCYPNAKFILTTTEERSENYDFLSIKNKLNGSDFVILQADDPNQWQVICEHLRCAPPSSSFPRLRDLDKRLIQQESTQDDWPSKYKNPKRDKSPWVVEPRKWWQGIRSVAVEDVNVSRVKITRISDFTKNIDTKQWLLRNDTFTDNLALFRPANVEVRTGVGAILVVKSDSLGVRDYSAASICSRNQYLYGEFEANLQASNVPGVVTGFFLHRNSPRQEIDIEIAGNRPDQLMVNVFFNPGCEGANFDYGYRGTPTYIDLGFDASREIHRFTIAWSPNEIIWKVDGRIVHRRAIWDPTPIPHLPMSLHVNSWPTRSVELAGRINKRRLPGTAILGSIALEANSVTSIRESDPNEVLQKNNELIQARELVQ
jgi:GR25 family glycosyltransferase involved in LPS biosynthesis/shikimate kinase